MRRRARASWIMGLLAVVLGLGPALVAGTPRAAASGDLVGNGSVDEAWLTGATPGDSITLLQNGSPVSNPANPGVADALGSLIIRDLTPGTGYQWQDDNTSETTDPFPVLAPGQNPAQSSSLYTGQAMSSGLNYITMRDGVQLAATVRFPYGVTCTASNPCPTVIEYSGYATAGPTDPIPFLIAQTLNTPCTGCGDPNLLPSGATEVGSVLSRFVGFATVSLQMRGTGCSGGAYDLFGYPSDYDAYDAIEIAAHQSWVAHGKVGMVGISYSGLSQLPSAGTNPPDLAAITPLSPTDDLFSTGYPGGIFNDGFAASWINDRINDAKPAATWDGTKIAQLSSSPVTNVAQPWTYYQIDNELTASGGTSSACLANQALHDESESLETLVGAQMVQPGVGPGRDPSLFDRRSMSKWASHITVPVFASGALQDEQTGPQWPALLQALPSTLPVFANMVNGGHIDSTDPQILSRWLEFLDIYVAQKIPSDPGGLGDVVLGGFTNFGAGTTCTGCLPPLRFTTDKTLAKAQSDFAKKTPRVQILFDSGAGAAGAGNPQSTYQGAYKSWPPKGKAVSFFFGASGSLVPKKAPKTGGSASLTLDPSVRPAVSLALGGNAWQAGASNWNWTVVPAPDAVAFQTPPFTATTTFAGPATLDLWVKSGTPVLDFQATVTEVRPGSSQEEYVTSGFLRSTNQTDLADSTSLYTDPNYLAGAAGSLSPSQFKLVKIPVDPIVHTFRPGTELRIVISAPGGDRPSWEFATVDSGQSATVGFGPVGSSALVVNQVHGVKPTATLPACFSLRGEPCRAYQAEGNQ